MLPQITIIGGLVDDPELRFTPAGKAVCNLRVGASDSKKDDAGNWETTERIYINVTLWEAEAESAAEHFVKADKVLVTGRIYQREYEKTDGTKGYSLEVKYPTVGKVSAGQRRDSSPQQRQAPANDPWSTAPTGGVADPPF